MRLERFVFIFCSLVLLSCISCKTKQERADTKSRVIRIAKTVDLVYREENDSNFSKRQDTVFYKDHLFTGYRYDLYPNGDTALLQSYFNGVEEGYQRKWYPAKLLAEERFYINGKKEGIHRAWWPDGKPKLYFEAYNDQYEGVFREWYASGMMAKEFHYLNGQEEGSEKLWWDNGTVRANYVIRNGKKYGLLGLTTCKNPYDSILKK